MSIQSLFTVGTVEDTLTLFVVLTLGITILICLWRLSIQTALLREDLNDAKRRWQSPPAPRTYPADGDHDGDDGTVVPFGSSSTQRRPVGQ